MAGVLGAKEGEACGDEDNDTCGVSLYKGQPSVHEQQNHHLSRTEPAEQLVSPGELSAFNARTDRGACIPLSFINEGCPDILTWRGVPLLSAASDVELTVATQGGHWSLRGF